MTKNMNKNELGKMFNESIVNAIGEGFCPSNEIHALYNASDAEWYMVMSKGDERIVLYWNSERMCENFEDEWYGIRRFELKVSRFNLGGKEMGRSFDRPKKWNEHAETIATLYAVDGDYDGKWLTDDIDEAIAARKKRRERVRGCFARESYEPMEVNDALLAIAKRHDGFKTVTSETLKVSRLRSDEGIIWSFSRTKNGKTTNSFYVKTAA